MAAGGGDPTKAAFRDGENSVAELLHNASTMVTRIRVAESSAELTTLQNKARAVLLEVERQIGDLDSLTADMGPKDRVEMSKRVERFRGDLATTRADFERESTTASRKILLGAGGERLSEEELRKREAAASTSDRLDRGTDKLVKSQALLHESVEMGVSTLDHLDDQERRLLNAKRATVQTEALVGEANVAIRGILSRTWGNKLCLYAVIGVLVVADILILYFGWLA